MTLDPFEPVLATLDALAFRLDRGEYPEAAEMDAIAAAATEAAGRADVAVRVRLFAAVERVATALARGCARLDERISTTAVGRRAVRAYGVSA